jgi:hypothetical protein
MSTAGSTDEGKYVTGTVNMRWVKSLIDVNRQWRTVGLLVETTKLRLMTCICDISLDTVRPHSANRGYLIMTISGHFRGMHQTEQVYQNSIRICENYI